MVTTVCPTAVAAGTAYQALSMTTGGLRFPLCDTTSYDAVFQAIADGVVSGATIACEFPIPDPPPGETIDLATVVVEYTPGGGGAAQHFHQVASAAVCEPDGFYIEGPTIKLCPDTCSVVQADPEAKLGILFGCEVTSN